MEQKNSLIKISSLYKSKVRLNLKVTKKNKVLSPEETLNKILDLETIVVPKDSYVVLVTYHIFENYMRNNQHVLNEKKYTNYVFLYCNNLVDFISAEIDFHVCFDKVQ